MNAESHDLPPVDRYRSYLLVLARAQIDRRLAGRLDASDIVQQALLEAHRDAGAARAVTSAQRAAWLRRILANNLANAVRDLRRQCRDPTRERSLDDALAATEVSARQALASDDPSPSAVAAAREDVLQLADAIQRLPADQQQAVVLRYWQGCPVAEIGARMERSPAAVASLLHRGLDGLRDTLKRIDPRGDSTP